jgi:hypothetical protein
MQFECAELLSRFKVQAAGSRRSDADPGFDAPVGVAPDRASRPALPLSGLEVSDGIRGHAAVPSRPATISTRGPAMTETPQAVQQITLQMDRPTRGTGL